MVKLPRHLLLLSLMAPPNLWFANPRLVPIPLTQKAQMSHPMNMDMDM